MDNHLHLFLEFLVAGVLFGLTENIVLIWVSAMPLSLNVVLLSLIVTVPFAALGELIVDKGALLPHQGNKWVKRCEVVLEFLVFGIAMGIVEDLLVLVFLTGETVSLEMIGVAAAITFPFAFVGEVLVDEHVVEG